MVVPGTAKFAEATGACVGESRSSAEDGGLSPAWDSSEKSFSTPSVLTDETASASPAREPSAWITAIACCALSFIIWGFPNSSGVFLAAYQRSPRYSSQTDAETLLPMIGPLCTGVLHCSGLFIHPSIRHRPRLRQAFIWAGALICSASLLGASFTSNAALLVAFKGAIFGLGASLVYYPALSCLSDCFVQRQNVPINAIIVIASNAGGVLFPIILPAIMSRFSIMVAARTYAIALAAVLLLSVPFIKSRPGIRHAHRRTGKAGSPMNIQSRRFWFFVAMNTLQSLGHFVPLAWLPRVAILLGLSTAQASLPLALANTTSVVAGFAMGRARERCNTKAHAVLTPLFTSAVTLVLWGVASSSYGGVLAFGIAYGATAGCWAGLWKGLVEPIADGNPEVAEMMVDLAMFIRGVGCIVSTPIVIYLQHARVATAQARGTGFAVDEGRFSSVIIYTGTCFAAAAALAVLDWALDRRSTRK
ncbi:MFS general substrate transporter [Phanerochaete sordida]|uniref:MFS general substrate transporter n=1 Tax=Phanerochaete sordida TaxID=48140 RepID=A0A9P3GKW0_9APHY|nr:MFS general substrate transporter [Phanerochaete sordida]